MSQQYDSVTNCILAETQLQSEQKWLELVLKLIVKERNSLQIERLELMSRQLKSNIDENNESGNERMEIDNEIDKSIAVTSAVNMMQNIASLTSRSHALQQEISDKVNSYKEAMQNAEELNLSATNSFLTEINQQNQEEDEEEEEEEDDFDFVIDMNMLMNGNK